MTKRYLPQSRRFRPRPVVLEEVVETLAEGTGAFAVDYQDGFEAGESGVVDEFTDDRLCLIDHKASYINFTLDSCRDF